MPPDFTPNERAILGIVQSNLPFSLTPYADIAAQTGTSEAEVLALLCQLKEAGAIRRFGASIRHQRAGWAFNEMVAWIATPEQAEQCGPIAARNAHVSHAYYRPSPAKDWPYTFYTMVHGRSRAECQDVIADLAQIMRLPDFVSLRSVRELKKTSMTYFSDGDSNG